MSQQSTRKSIKTTLFAVIGAIIGYTSFQYFFNSPSLDKQLMYAASEINKTCPIMVDKDTRLDNAMSSSSQDFQYNYTLPNYTKEEIDTTVFEKALKPQLVNTISTNPDLKIFRDNNVTIIYNYKDKNGVFLLRISITPAEYKK